ncbi:helix-turn-helix domain-containing protein [Dyadobacter sp. CY261]|uniref:helix-turn-helix transcriptional regulator n=1 Tax=Dyadobacter sp. CY261 TaxID=2907203 RepID=UPI001F2AB9FF|nr:helix-turn-helix domain-containing protein [Dyadobacter sp. CY261]MCF0069425.1 helix-turn-helix domain-containing protein [Dyadobacter sp. CY261]
MAAQIIKPGRLVLPSLNEGWRFNFHKQAQKKDSQAFVLVCENTPEVIEDKPYDYTSLHDFVKRYLKVLGVTQKQLAELFEMKDSNLHKYLTGERKLNADIAFKLASFSKTSPEHWFRLEIRNELKKLGSGKGAEFEKYGYEKLVPVAE